MEQQTSITARIVEIGGDLFEAIDVGRHGEATVERCELEIQRFAGNKPFLNRVVGAKYDPVRARPVLRLRHLDETGRRLTGGQNGECWYDIDADGIYVAGDVLFSGSRRLKVYFYRDASGIVPLSRDEAFAAARVLYEDQFRAVDAAQHAMDAATVRVAEIADEIRAERAEFEAIRIDGMEAVPEFDDIDEDGMRIRIARGDFDAEKEVDRRVAPSHYVVNEPVFAKASTAEEAVKQAKAKIEQARKREEERKAAAAKARQAAKESGLPQLTGSPRQIRWAEQIRAAAAKKEPGIPELKRWKKASRWIEARSRWAQF